MILLTSPNKGISFVPKSVLVFLAVSFLLQISWHYYFTELKVKRYELPAVTKPLYMRLVSLDAPIPVSKLTMLWLQAFDNQPGISLALNDLDYDRVIDWLELVLALDEQTQYPLLAAIRFYAGVQDETKQRKMIAFVSKKFVEDPEQRWATMAHAVYIAKYKVKDIDLALKSARLIRKHVKTDRVPYWAKQMEIFILEEMGELESAKILIGGLLESGELKDPHQQQFLKTRLAEIEKRQE